jgi:hypothetical protein
LRKKGSKLDLACYFMVVWDFWRSLGTCVGGLSRTLQVMDV